MRKEKISGCLIVKNEAEDLARCVKSMLPILDELIIVDTGSTDNTIEIAKRYTNKIFSYNWNNDFAAARNYAISKAKMPWIIFLDADEYFSERSLKNIRRTIDNENGKADAFLINGYDIVAPGGEIKDKFTVVRVFRNNPKLRYQGRIHESLRKKGQLLIVDCTDIIELFHTGYAKDVIGKKNKNERNLMLLLEEVEERPDDGNIHFYLSLQYMSIGDYKKVMEHARKALNLGITILGREATAYLNFVKAGFELKHDLVELLDFSKQCVEKHPNFPDGYLVLIECHLKKGDIDHALFTMEEFLNKDFKDDLRYVSNLNENVYENIYEKLGDIYCQDKKDYNKAVFYYIKLLKQDIYNETFFKKLMDILLNFERTADIIKFLQKIYNDKTVKDMYFLGVQFARLNHTEMKEYYKNKLAELDD